jgi:hypothetical protein
MELFMIQTEVQSEERQQTAEQTLTREVRTAKRSRTSWLVLVIAAIVVAALLGSGIWSTRRDGSSRSHFRIGGVAETNSAGRRNHPARKRATLHHISHLLPYKWLSEEVVFRHWGACQEGPASCRHRNAGGRPATPTSARQLVNGAGKFRARFRYQKSLSRALEKQRRIPAGRRQRSRDLQRE